MYDELNLLDFFPEAMKCLKDYGNSSVLMENTEFFNCLYKNDLTFLTILLSTTIAGLIAICVGIYNKKMKNVSPATSLK